MKSEAQRNSNQGGKDNPIRPDFCDLEKVRLLETKEAQTFLILSGHYRFVTQHPSIIRDWGIND